MYSTIAQFVGRFALTYVATTVLTVAADRVVEKYIEIIRKRELEQEKAN